MHVQPCLGSLSPATCLLPCPAVYMCVFHFLLKARVQLILTTFQRTSLRKSLNSVVVLFCFVLFLFCFVLFFPSSSSFCFCFVLFCVLFCFLFCFVLFCFVFVCFVFFFNFQLIDKSIPESFRAY